MYDKGFMTFSYQFEEGAPEIIVTIPSDAGLEEILDSFENFLLGAGYRFTGEIALIDSFEPVPEDNFDYNSGNTSSTIDDSELN